ncbi:hypothetical protein ACHZG4_001719 [Yersinia enterocolitica]|uniref:hypothetical protein n=1 Tax=Yersinia TaxID=629 RepID=UPI0011A6D5DA|nr:MULTISPECIES: hypothetical protein [Yersinia]EKN4030611.1 hypothetical protein [Yersinia enterocolitica]EKN4101781.1 hypothetical protein [Yersinia enterocolitica]EKN5091453.1 hypothetical protein [Yersinia enterocolitica]ELI8061553.1 hypothetical protein [Yersinia enterocolitica]HDL7718683.1 hypothetical protein [Yersinia enterocolitica]
MSNKAIPVIIPAELEYREHNHLACLRFHYHLEDPSQVPQAGELFTGLTLEQAVDTVQFLQEYIQRARLASGYIQGGNKPN